MTISTIIQWSITIIPPTAAPLPLWHYCPPVWEIPGGEKCFYFYFLRFLEVEIISGSIRKTTSLFTSKTSQWSLWRNFLVLEYTFLFFFIQVLPWARSFSSCLSLKVKNTFNTVAVSLQASLILWFCVTLLSLKALHQGVEVRSWEAREGLQLEEACRSRRRDCRWDNEDDQIMGMIKSWGWSDHEDDQIVVIIRSWWW